MVYGSASYMAGEGWGLWEAMWSGHVVSDLPCPCPPLVFPDLMLWGRVGGTGSRHELHINAPFIMAQL